MVHPRKNRKRPSARWAMELLNDDEEWRVVTERTDHTRVAKARHIWAHPRSEVFILEKGCCLGTCSSLSQIRRSTVSAADFSKNGDEDESRDNYIRRMEAQGKLLVITRDEAVFVSKLPGTQFFDDFDRRSEIWQPVVQLFSHLLPK